MSWTDSQIESLITFYSSMLVSGARNFATGVKNRRQKPTSVFWCRFLAPVSGACAIGIRHWSLADLQHINVTVADGDDNYFTNSHPASN